MAELYDITETAPRLRSAKITLRRLIKKRKIPYHRIGSRYFFTEEDINKYLASVSYPIKEENV